MLEFIAKRRFNLFDNCIVIPMAWWALFNNKILLSILTFVFGLVISSVLEAILDIRHDEKIKTEYY